jgi:NTE family protein
MGNLPSDVEVVAFSGTSGGAICASLAWEGFLRDDMELGIGKLQSFWETMSAREPWDKMLNQSLMNVMSLRDTMVMPEVSPYHLPTWGADRFADMLNQYFDFEELRKLASEPGAPVLHIGAVEVLSGHFEVFKGDHISADVILASAAIPELYRAVNIPGRGVFWDGLFSQNPPIRCLVKERIDEIWIVQINPTACSRLPTETHEILDRRNELSGNLAMEQELHFIEAINRAIVRGELKKKYRPIRISRIPLERDLSYQTKMDRRPELLEELREYGKTRSRLFLKQRELRLAGAA